MSFNWYMVMKYEFRELTIRLLRKVAFLFLLLIKNMKPLNKSFYLPPCGNSKIGLNLINGAYIFSGVKFDLDLDNPWLIETPSIDVERSLHGFFWLNDLAAVGTVKARNRAYEWMTKWSYYSFLGKRVGWDTHTTALRCLNIVRNKNFLARGVSNQTVHYEIHLWRQYHFLKFMLFLIGIHPFRIP